jgi:hypothetical protein
MSRIRVCGALEIGYAGDMEHLVWRQLKGAYGVELVLAPRDYPTMQDLIDNLTGKKIFLIPPGRMESKDLDTYELPDDEEINFIFGRPGDNLVKYVKEEDDVVSIHTPNDVDMMAISTAGIVLNRYGDRQ